jgi:hypothetical protein
MDRGEASAREWCKQNGYVMMRESDYEQAITKAYFEGQNASTSEIQNKCGKWIREKKHHKDDFQEFDYWDVRCSECGARKRIGWADVLYCPMCGAKMEGGVV